ncbi:F-box/kelch-repeat protein At3g23880-like [Corylus avellana]|uniref:F-box/kelch-repeat protein At3g23880-like n=1 Tax=Corylus avellana TaxID=13451 RepID=UPI00286BCCBA|nr:F-box/kelch-repeat protein At3g23880-like [Corylus avellana]XP_059445064.1 F-box/kelch-repeat protein At3g23880-like [Corylus avellana]
MSDRLPHEIITDILSRMPGKSLMRLRCVSKAWCSLISTPNFISTHLSRSLSNSQHQPCLYANYGHIGTLLMYPSNQEIEEQKEDFLANPSERRELYDPSNNEFELVLVGSSNGLLGLAYKRSKLCVLWNSSIQIAITLPKPNIGFDGSIPLDHSVGFGYDPTTDDYKFVRLVYSSYRTLRPLVEIYTLRTGIWRSVTAPVPPCIITEDLSPSVFVNGSLHWSALRAFSFVIMSFNMKDEAFGEVGMPKGFQGPGDLKVTVALCDGMLALVIRDGYDGKKTSTTVWVMKEYGVAESWTKLFDLPVGLYSPHSKVIGFTKSGELLMEKGTR